MWYSQVSIVFIWRMFSEATGRTAQTACWLQKKSKRLHNNVHLCHSICISSNKTLDVVHPVLFVNAVCHHFHHISLHYVIVLVMHLCCLSCVFPLSPAVYYFPRFARAYYFPLLCLCVCHVTAGQPIRQSTNCSGRTAARWLLMSGFGGALETLGTQNTRKKKHFMTLVQARSLHEHLILSDKETLWNLYLNTAVLSKPLLSHTGSIALCYAYVITANPSDTPQSNLQPQCSWPCRYNYMSPLTNPCRFKWWQWCWPPV